MVKSTTGPFEFIWNNYRYTSLVAVILRLPQQLVQNQWHQGLPRALQTPSEPCLSSRMQHFHFQQVVHVQEIEVVARSILPLFNGQLSWRGGASSFPPPDFISQAKSEIFSSPFRSSFQFSFRLCHGLLSDGVLQAAVVYLQICDHQAADVYKMGPLQSTSTLTSQLEYHSLPSCGTPITNQTNGENHFCSSQVKWPLLLVWRDKELLKFGTHWKNSMALEFPWTTVEWLQYLIWKCFSNTEHRHIQQTW